MLLFCNSSTKDKKMIMDEPKEDYYRRKAIELQDTIPTYKSAATLTSEAFIWTYRTTSCDVLSIITTSVPVHNAGMSDVKSEFHEPGR